MHTDDDVRALLAEICNLQRQAVQKLKTIALIAGVSAAISAATCAILFAEICAVFLVIQGYTG